MTKPPKARPRAVSAVWTVARARRRLLLGVVAFALALGAPLGLLMKHVYEQLRMEAFLQLSTDADDLAARIDRRAQDLLATEEGRRFEEFNFLNVLGNATANFLQLSPLSRFPPETRLPGIVGYFQLDPDGRYSSPLLPRDAASAAAVGQYGIDKAEFDRRRDREREVLHILNANDIAKATGPAATIEAEQQLAKSQAPTAYPSKEPGPQPAARDGLRAAPDEELELDSKAMDLVQSSQRQKKDAPEKAKIYTKRKQEISIPDTDAMSAGVAANAGAPGAPANTKSSVAGIKTFQGELDPFQFGFLTSGHVVLYRKVWREGRRYIQGALMERQAFLATLFRQSYAESPLSGSARLAVHHGGDLLATFPPGPAAPARSGPRRLIGRHQLSAPFDAVSLAFTVDRVVIGPSVRYVLTICALLIVVLAVGIVAIFLAGQRQIALSQQQRDFVSAVSHELKTPLTSIRMYSEMLREGWAAEDKKRGYYDFIFSESERLSRLIANVLQLARLSRGQTLAAEKVAASAAYARVSEVIATQILGAGFTRRELLPAAGADPEILVDPDALTQIFVNLVDNGIKFSRKTGQTRLETGYELSPTGAEVRFLVRDFGPGIQKDQLKRIFKLFYRPENELTRTTKGTGIGLALVNELATQMGGRVDVESQPGQTDFRVILPVLKRDS